jgi:Domain of unknown function (DUF4417)
MQHDRTIREMIEIIPPLREDMLATTIPCETWSGERPIVSASTKLFVYRTADFSALDVSGGVLAFFTDDFRFSCIWRNTQKYAQRFLEEGWAAVAEPDFSLWTDSSREQQVESVFRTRMVGRIFQNESLKVIPTLSWSDEQSFKFAFCGIPRGAHVVAVECRTASHSEADRARFLAGLNAGVRQIRPLNVIIYAGTSHSTWLTAATLPRGPNYHFLSGWQSARFKRLKAEKAEREASQISLFGGAET